MEYGEMAELYMELRPNAFDGYIFTNEDKTTMSFVVEKNLTDAIGEAQVCIMWAGNSPDGHSLVPMIKPDPSVLPPRKSKGDSI